MAPFFVVLRVFHTDTPILATNLDCGLGRQVKDGSHVAREMISIIGHMAKAFLHGSAYWLARRANEIEYDDFIVSFNMTDYLFDEISLPRFRSNDCALTGSLVVFRDSLYLFANDSLEWWHIWMMGEGCSGKI
ncbi:hypothetical protein CQW23_23458 [Capsicum baccatum]|uniref:F-box associated beta-propeller type 1 domain-containing protein n=1 Tax=Capsicum baccatum TaxID=33114 RepID=A0A2G2VS14_CAPBA|nr:hypothetical protein CQW23_23458 [Capsicum baccatum]